MKWLSNCEKTRILKQRFKQLSIGLIFLFVELLMSAFMLLNRWFGIQLNPHFLGIDLKYVTCFELCHPPCNNAISLITTSHTMMPKTAYLYWFSVLWCNPLIIFTNRWIFLHDFLSLLINIRYVDPHQNGGVIT